MGKVRRRQFLIAAGVLLAAPSVAIAQQQTKVWRIGFLVASSRPPSLDSSVFGGFLRGMRELGYVEGKNFVVEWRFADGKYERLRDFAQEFVRLKVDVIVASSSPSTRAAQQVTKTIPIVIGASGDPVAGGLVASLAKPGGNTTGLSQNLTEIAPKLLELVKIIVPTAAQVAMLVNPGTSDHGAVLKSLQGSAQKIGVKILPMEARTAEEIEGKFGAMVREHVNAVIVPPDALFNLRRQQIVEEAFRYRLPSIFLQREYVELGGLMSYGQSLAELFRRAATYVDKIFKGATPGDLPVEQPNIFELVVNMKTARTLGLTIPRSLLLRADRVIE